MSTLKEKSQLGTLFVITGPSGAGKTTLANLIQTRNASLSKIITATTRSPRFGEVHGVNYIFMSNDAFHELHKNNGFIEVNNYNQQWYGTPRSAILELLKSGKPGILIADIHGACALKKEFSNTIVIWVDSPTEELKKRLVQRNSENAKDIENRIALVFLERAHHEKTGVSDYCVSNIALEEALESISRIINTSKSS